MTTLSHLVTTLRSSEATVTFPNTLQWWHGDSVFLLVLLWFEVLGWIHLAQDKDHCEELTLYQQNLFHGASIRYSLDLTA
jgi:hypothetical protein